MSGPDTGFVSGFERGAAVAVVEGDRLCRGCGYALRGQQVRREPNTAMLLCRCPECGAFASAQDYVPAGQVWLRRLAGPAVVLWVGTILGVLGLLAFALWIDLIVFVEFLLERDWDPQARRSSRRLIDLNEADKVLQMVLIVGVAGLCGALSTTVLTVVSPHWPRWGYVLAACAVPAVAFAGLELLLWADAPGHLADFLVVIHLLTAALLSVSVSAGIVMAWRGRPFARLLVRVFLPPKLRAPLAYLWLGDGTPPPPGVRPGSCGEFREARGGPD